MSGLVSHTTPDGRSHTSSRTTCEVWIKKLQKLIDENWKIAHIETEAREGGPFRMFGTIEINFEIPVEILVKAGFRK